MVKKIAVLAVVALLLVGALYYSQIREERPAVSGFIEADEIRLGSRVGGRVAKVRVEEGQAVKAGEVLVELEPHVLLEERGRSEARLAEKKAALQQAIAGFRPEEIAQAKAHRDRLAARLALLEHGPREEEIAQARARKDQLAARLDLLKVGPRPEEVAAARSRVELAQAELVAADAKYRRTEALSKQNAASREELDLATEGQKVARANEAVRREELEALLQGTRREEIAEAAARLDEAEHALALLANGYRPEEIAQARAELEEAEQAWILKKNGYRAEEIEGARASVAAAEAELAATDRQVAELSIRAPADGMVEAIELQPGDLVAANAPVLALADLRRLWVRAYVPENRLDLSIGEEVGVTVDSFPGETFRGRVSFVARQAEFTPGNVQTPEERSKQVFRIRVVLEEGLDRLRPGMSADVWLDEPEGSR